ncbi:MAG: hypothetical protein ABSA09_11965 [Desulfobaccales bacterium]|jgi:hypothetical protein
MNLRKVSGSPLLIIEPICHLSGVRKSTLHYWEVLPSLPLTFRKSPGVFPGGLVRVRTIKRLLEEDHLTATGVGLRLGELFPPPRKASGDARQEPEESE